jgi:hypothetical protein
MIGDTIRFVNPDSCEIKITGRTRQFLSLCGEHLSVDNMNEGVYKTATALGVEFPEFTVKGTKHNGVMGHHWYLACNTPGLDAEQVRQKLDAYLSELNDDYGVERKHVLQEMRLDIYPESVFLGWMEKNGKMGGQSKFPRVMADAHYEDWCQYLQSLQHPTP